MTGRAADAGTITFSPGATVPTTYPKRKNTQRVESSQDNRTSWNNLEPVVMDSKLRPQNKKHFRTLSYTDAESMDKTVSELPKPSHSRRALEVPIPEPLDEHAAVHNSKRKSVTKTTKKRKGGKGYRYKEGCAEPSYSQDRSSTDSDRPLRPIYRPSLQRITPPSTASRSATTAPASQQVFQPDSSPCRAQNLLHTRLGNSNRTEVRPEIDLTLIKDEFDEPLFWNSIIRTELLVSTSNEKEKAPITITFGNLRSSDDLFTTLTRECELRSDVAKRVKRISATYKWNGKRHGLRRDKDEDWTRFVKAIGKAWDAESFMESCEIESKFIHRVSGSQECLCLHRNRPSAYSYR